MMLFLIILWALLANVPSISAANTMKFTNRCPYPVYAWTVGPARSNYKGEDHEAVTLPANTVTTHHMISGEDIGGGISLKLRDLPSYRVAPAGILQVEYNFEVSKNSLWYDLSAINCDAAADPEDPSFCPLIQSGVRLHIENANAHHGDCPEAGCGAEGCYNTYRKHGFWHGEPTFKCEAGSDVVVEFCTERAGPRTFHGNAEPGHPAEEVSEVKPGHPTTDGICGAKAPGGATCSGFAHGNCCSEYGWCGFSELHCGKGCQHGFGDCFGQLPGVSSTYQAPSKSSSAQPSYAKPTSSHVKPTPSQHSAVPSSSAPGNNYSAPASSYHVPNSTYSTPALSYTQPSSEYSHIEHTWSSYDKSTSSYAAPSKPTPGYHSPPPDSHSPATNPHYSLAPSHTVYATLTVTITRATLTETLYHTPTPEQSPSEHDALTTSSVYHTPYGTPVHSVLSTSTVGEYERPVETRWVGER